MNSVLRDLDDAPREFVDTFGTTCLGLAVFLVQLSELHLVVKIAVGAATILYLGTKSVIAVLRYLRARKQDREDPQ